MVGTVLSLAACGTASGPLADLPRIADPARASKVIVYRVSSIVGAANGYTVALDGEDVFGIGSGEFAEFLVPEGAHRIAVKCFGGMSPTWKQDDFRFDALRSEITPIVIRPTMGCADITRGNQTEADWHLRNARRIHLR